MNTRKKIELIKHPQVCETFEIVNKINELIDAHNTEVVEKVGVDVIVCPIHDNIHFCRHKIDEGCNCKCTCTSLPVTCECKSETKSSWEHELLYKLTTWRKFYPDMGDEEYKERMIDFVTSLLRSERNAVLEEVDGLLVTHLKFGTYAASDIKEIMDSLKK